MHFPPSVPVCLCLVLNSLSCYCLSLTSSQLWFMDGNRMRKLGHTKLGLSLRSTRPQRVLSSHLERSMYLVTLLLRLNRNHILSELKTKLQYLTDEGKPPLSYTIEKWVWRFLEITCTIYIKNPKPRKEKELKLLSISTEI